MAGGRLAETREAFPVACTPEAEAVIATWVPHSVRDAHPAVLAETRTVAAAMRPETPLAARRLLWALSPFGVWAHRTVGTFTADTNQRPQRGGLDRRRQRRTGPEGGATPPAASCDR